MTVVLETLAIVRETSTCIVSISEPSYVCRLRGEGHHDRIGLPLLGLLAVIQLSVCRTWSWASKMVSSVWGEVVQHLGRQADCHPAAVVLKISVSAPLPVAPNDQREVLVLRVKVVESSAHGCSHCVAEPNSPSEPSPASPSGISTVTTCLHYMFPEMSSSPRHRYQSSSSVG